MAKPADVRRQFDLIEPELHRFPAIDAASFRSAVEAALRAQKLADGKPQVSGIEAPRARFGRPFPVRKLV
jgi:hypothetical protein